MLRKRISVGTEIRFKRKGLGILGCRFARVPPAPARRDPRDGLAGAQRTAARSDRDAPKATMVLPVSGKANQMGSDDLVISFSDPVRQGRCKISGWDLHG